MGMHEALCVIVSQCSRAEGHYNHVHDLTPLTTCSVSHATALRRLTLTCTCIVASSLEIAFKDSHFF